jgi:aminoglycoside 6'-N-acetyltransferase
MILRGPRLVLRPLRADDADCVAAIAAEPEVARWWGILTAAELRAKAAGGEGVEALAVELGGEVIGMLQVAEEPDPTYRHAGIDMFLSAPAQGRGLGREALTLVCRHLFGERRHHRITIDPAADNQRAIRCYTAVGFRAVGTMRLYERGRDGSFHDGVLMELIREDQ